MGQNSLLFLSLWFSVSFQTLKGARCSLLAFHPWEGARGPTWVRPRPPGLWSQSLGPEFLVSTRHGVKQSTMPWWSILGENSKHFSPLHLSINWSFPKKDTMQSNPIWDSILLTQRRGRTRSALIVGICTPELAGLSQLPTQGNLPGTAPIHTAVKGTPFPHLRGRHNS